jgi:SAM-dependent methyltransferase
VDACYRCAERAACGGPPAGCAAGAPFDRPRSNSFDYRLGAAVPGFAAGRCPLADAPGRIPARALHVRTSRGVRAARAPSRDFGLAAMREVRALGQIYGDRSRKPAPDDFAADLAKLALDPLCPPCPRRHVCAGLWRPAGEDVFARDDGPVLETLAGLRGRVLDVGAGRLRYREAVRAAEAAGRIEYHALDPDARAVAELRAAGLDRVRHGPLEAMAAPERPFDHVLLLRSWNHLPDPAAALARIAQWLRPGGTLLIVDNVPFAVVRSPGQVRRGHAPGAAAFEHWRCDSSWRALRIAQRAGVPLLVRRHDPVRPDGANQWLLWLERT